MGYDDLLDTVYFSRARGPVLDRMIADLPKVATPSDNYCMWRRHANRALDLYRRNLIRRDRAVDHIEAAHERLKALPCPVFFWIAEDDALQPGAIDRVVVS